ncbi:hypothetical protein J132_02385 [Termitomyces sp. J132]|nr:hypothetical protein J132_02385 [Termitomyces sp. J132]
MKRGFLKMQSAKKAISMVYATSTTAEPKKVKEVTESFTADDDLKLVELGDHYHYISDLLTNTSMFTGSGGVGVKAPIGKFNPTLPKDYVPPKHKVEFHDAKTVDYTDQHIIFTTIGPESDE